MSEETERMIEKTRKPPHARKADIWAAAIELVLDNDVRIDYDEINDVLAHTMRKAEAVRLAFITICRKHNEDPDLILDVCRDIVGLNEKTPPSR